MNIFEIFKKSSDYDPNLSWDKALKLWEENFLGKEKTLESNENFDYKLESDNSFSNSLQNENDNLSSLFDSSFSNKHNFNCVNKSCMETYDIFLNINNDNYTWTIPCSNKYLSKPFIRFILKKNLNENDIKNLLYLLADCSFSIVQGGTPIYSLKKMLLIFLICEKLSVPIKTFDVNTFLEQYSMEEIHDMIFKNQDNRTTINQKYYVSNKNDIYLDVPLLINFFSYNMPVLLNLLSYHRLDYVLTIPYIKKNMIFQYVDKIVFMFEEISINKICKLQKSPIEFIIMKCNYYYFHHWKENITKLEVFNNYSKFIFVIVRPSVINNYEKGIINKIDCDFDMTQLPQITNIELLEYYRSRDTKTGINKKSMVDLKNVWVCQFENIVIYGIASDGVSSMKNWIKVLNECVNSTDKLQKITKTYNNYNTSNTNNIYEAVHLDEIKIEWTDSSIQVDIEIISINNNIQQYLSGMTGSSYGY